jgi:D-isomer specific 2-hydroxyacid dehydrogenase, NAD binding domain
VIEPALEAVRARAPGGVEVLAINGALDLQTIDFLVPSAESPAALEQLPDLDRVSVVQVLSAGTDWIEGRLPPQATLCSARGPVIDTDALLSHVADGRLRAVLDVTDPEPLPDGHPLWTAPRNIVRIGTG